MSPLTRAHRSAGFTAVEMLVVLAILALVAGLAYARFGSRPGLDVEGAARGLTYQLRTLRSAAISANRTLTLTATADGRGFVITGRTGVPLPRGVVATLANGKPIVFFPDGTSSGGAIVLSNGRAESRVTIDWLTGHAAVAAGG